MKCLRCGGYSKTGDNIRYTDFRKEVSKYYNEDLISAVSETARKHFLSHPVHSGCFLPWALDAIIKESIFYGRMRPHTGNTIKDRTVLDLCHAFMHVYEKRTKGDNGLSLLMYLASQQFFYQGNRSASMFRNISIIERHKFTGKLDVITAENMKQMLNGITVEEVSNVWLILLLETRETGGWVTPKFLSEDNKATWAVCDRSSFLSVLTNFSEKIPEIREQQLGYYQSLSPAAQELFNPLTIYPSILSTTGNYLLPSPSMIVENLSPTNMYSKGSNLYHNRFGGDLGHLIEHYAGRQLRLMENVEVIPEILYYKSKKLGNQLSVDYFLIFPDLVVLAEVKVGYLKLDSKSGGDNLKEDLNNILGKACRQIKSSNMEIINKNVAFDRIPRHLPRMGMIITSEPLYFAGNNPGFSMDEVSGLPTIVISLDQLEHMVMLPQIVLSSTLKKFMYDTTEPWVTTQNILTSVSSKDNPLLKEIRETMSANRISQVNRFFSE